MQLNLLILNYTVTKIRNFMECKSNVGYTDYGIADEEDFFPRVCTYVITCSLNASTYLHKLCGNRFVVIMRVS